MRKFIQFLLLSCLLALTLGCDEHYTPKPRGYFRIDLPEKKYTSFESACSFTAELPKYSQVEIISEASDSCWFNVVMPRHHARIHCTYLRFSGNVTPLVEDAYNFAFKHEVKANAIKRNGYQDSDSKVYGMVYDLTGNVASPVQFYVTDSVQHFIRGSLYFEHIPNADSIAPVIEFIRQDVLHFMETLEWSAL